MLRTHVPGDSGCVGLSCSDGDVDHDGRAAHVRTVYSLELHLRSDALTEY